MYIKDRPIKLIYLLARNIKFVTQPYLEYEIRVTSRNIS